MKDKANKQKPKKSEKKNDGGKGNSTGAAGPGGEPKAKIGGLEDFDDGELPDKVLAISDEWVKTRDEVYDELAKIAANKSKTSKRGSKHEFGQLVCYPSSFWRRAIWITT